MTDETRQSEQEKSPAQADYEAGQEFFKKGDSAQAANSFHNALIGYQQAQNDKGVANASDKLGDICLQRQDHGAALKHYETANAICEKSKDLFSVIALKKKIAQARRGQGEYDLAIGLYLDLVDIFQSFKNPQRTVDILELLAETYLEKGERSKAADVYRTAASIHANFKHIRHARELEEKAEALEA